MTTKQYNLLTTGNTVSATLETLPATSAFPALLAARTALDDTLDKIDDLAARQADPLPPRTRGRNEQLASASRTTHVIARLVLGYALTHQLDTLAGQVDFSPTDLGRGRIACRLQRMRQVLAAAREHAAELAGAGVTAEMLADAEAKTDIADAVSTLPRSNIVARRVATQNLEQAFAELERILRYSLDPLMETLQATDPDTYARYVSARHVINRPGRPSEQPEEPAAVAGSAQFPQPLAA